MVRFWSPLEPLCWMWLFSYLKSPTSWMLLSFMWRVPCTTFRTIVNEVIEQLQKTLNEVRTKHVGANKIGRFLTIAPYSRLTSTSVMKTYLRKVHFRTWHTSLIAWSSKSQDPIRRKRSWRFSPTNPKCRHSNTKVRYAGSFLCHFHQKTNILLSLLCISGGSHHDWPVRPLRWALPQHSRRQDLPKRFIAHCFR